MKKVILAIICILMFTSCGISRINDYSIKMYYLEKQFPQLYQKYMNDVIDARNMYYDKY